MTNDVANEANAAPGSSKELLGDPGTLLFENERVRVWELIMKPGETCNWHNHQDDHLLVVMEGANVQGEMADGNQFDLRMRNNDVFFVPGSPLPEIARNTSIDKTLRELIIEFKGPKQTATSFGRFGFFQDGTPTTTRPMAG